MFNSIIRPMRSWSAQIVVPVLGLALLCMGVQRAQPAPPPVTAFRPPCPVPKGKIVGQVKIAHVTFAGSYKIPLLVRKQIAQSIEQRVEEPSVKATTDQAVAMAESGWRNYGYMTATVISERATVNKSPRQTVSLTIRVEEGVQYRLGAITFRNNHVVHDIAAMRRLFPIKDGEILRSKRIEKGLAELRNAYGRLGYINFTSIPNMTLDEARKLVFLDMELDEGKQFYVLSIDILGVDDKTREKILEAAPLRRGQVYDVKLLDVLIKRYPALFKFSSDDPAHVWRELNEHDGTVAITLDARPCDQG